jgi:hypothetical protein
MLQRILKVQVSDTTMFNSEADVGPKIRAHQPAYHFQCALPISPFTIVSHLLNH